MLFKGKIDRVVNVEKSEERFRRTLEREKLEKNDPLAMVLAAVLTFLPAVAVMVLVFLAVIWLFFLR